MRRWLRLPTVGLPEAKALLAAEEERRRALRQQLSDAMPESLKSLAGMATDWMGEQFTPCDGPAVLTASKPSSMGTAAGSPI